jgi:hypothetical protein
LRPAVAIFTQSGRLISYSEKETLVRSVATALLDELPPAGEDPDTTELLKSRKRVLARIAAGEAGE